MSNQRRGKYKPASMHDGSSMSTVMFFKQAKILLEQSGNEDAAFYFEQVEDWLRAGNGLPTSDREVSKVLAL